LQSGGEGVILTQPLFVSYHVFSNLTEKSMNAADFSAFASFNWLSYFNRLVLISGKNRHQRHQAVSELNLQQSTANGIESSTSWSRTNQFNPTNALSGIAYRNWNRYFPPFGCP
jgi:hypothetical protein